MTLPVSAVVAVSPAVHLVDHVLVLVDVDVLVDVAVAVAVAVVFVVVRVVVGSVDDECRSICVCELSSPSVAYMVV